MTIVALVQPIGRILVALACMAAPGCTRSNAAPKTVEITVFAAASLADAFAEIGHAFTDANPEIEVTFNFAGSSELAAQLAAGAPADVFASADRATMARVIESGNAATEPVVFATNRAAIVVASGNPLGVTRIQDLARRDLVVVICSPEVPCGTYAEAVVANAGVQVAPKSYEASVKGVVSKVALGEADAGIVYATDVAAPDGEIEGVDIPTDLNVVATYPLVVTTASAHPDRARRFADFVRDDEGQQILASFGFGAP